MKTKPALLIFASLVVFVFGGLIRYPVELVANSGMSLWDRGIEAFDINLASNCCFIAGVALLSAALWLNRKMEAATHNR